MDEVIEERIEQRFWLESLDDCDDDSDWEDDGFEL